jgi:hypothetical protein
MDIKTSKIDLVKTILAIESNDLLQKVADFIDKEKVDFWHELSISEQLEINQGVEELNTGRKVTYDSFLKKISK